MECSHKPVLLEERINALNFRPDGIYCDGTLGGGGHALELLKRMTTGRLIAIDRDLTALEAAGKRLERYADKLTLVHGNHADIEDILDDAQIEQVDGMLFDLGVSSPQLDEAERGFSYMAQAPLDMRMDRFNALTAAEVVNTYDEARLRKILYEYGEERYSGRIASAIVKKREIKRIETTLELVEIIVSAMPGAALREKQHPAKRSFQAIRIEVNDELGGLQKMLKDAPERLRIGGRIAVISFHSLEDRLVKLAFRARQNGCTCPPDLPICVCGFRKTLNVITGKPVTASEAELETNPRARSARLRVAERCG
jgi:16S rRNA (cytosine1402-N4)-methyltransferase